MWRNSEAVREARFARETGFDLGLLSLTALNEASDSELIGTLPHGQAGNHSSLWGFFICNLAVGGRVCWLPLAFWREFCHIESVVGIKVAPFNRYQTLDVTAVVADSGRGSEIVLYTGNDDNIIPGSPGRLSPEGRSFHSSLAVLLGLSGPSGT